MKKMPVSETALEIYMQDLSILPRKDKKKYIVSKARLHGISESTLYRRLQEQKKGIKQEEKRKDKGTPRITSEKQLRQDLLKIVGLRQITKTKSGMMSLEEIYKILKERGDITQDYSPSTINRYVRKWNLTPKHFSWQEDGGASKELIALYPLHVVQIDASTAAQYYLSEENNKIYRHIDLGIDKNHSEDRLRRDRLKKIWFYVVVDMFTGICYAQAFADYRLGENSQHWAETLGNAMLPKKNNPLQGIPEHIYSDNGNPLLGKLMSGMLDYFDIKPKRHAVGKSRSKGLVERYVGIIKQRIEARRLLLGIEKRALSAEQFNMFIQEGVNYNNTEKGYSLKFIKNVNHLKTVTEYDIAESLTGSITRKMQAHGTVQINSKHYFVAHDIPRHSTITIHRRYGGHMVAEYNNQLYTLDPEKGKTPAIFGEPIKNWKLSESDKFRKEAIEEGRRIQASIIPQDIEFPTPSVLHMPVPKSKSTKFYGTRSIPAKEYKSVEEAWLYLAYAMGIPPSEIPQKTYDEYNKAICSIIEVNGEIDGSTMLKLYNSLIKKLEMGEEVINAES